MLCYRCKDELRSEALSFHTHLWVYVQYIMYILYYKARYIRSNKFVRFRKIKNKCFVRTFFSFSLNSVQ